LCSICWRKQLQPKYQKKNFEENKKIAKQGGTIAGNTRKEIEEKTGKKVVSKKNAKQLESSTEDGVLNPPDKEK